MTMKKKRTEPRHGTRSLDKLVLKDILRPPRSFSLDHTSPLTQRTAYSEPNV